MIWSHSRRNIATIRKMLVALFMIIHSPVGPVDYGLAEIAKEAGARSGDVSVSIKATKQPETYTISNQNGKVKIVGSDANGAMYGALEFAERLHNEGDKAWQTKATGKPFLKDRGLNLFLTLPWDYKKNDTDYDIKALTDPNRWWFQNDDYWTTLLDLMAKSRLNWLDIHGAWDISVTNAPNLYAYFVTSPTFPKVGVPEDVKQANLRQLNKVIEMAHARGIRVSLMAYEANLRIPQNPNPGYEATEKNIYTYTREVVEKMIRQAPGLDGIGFRIGESGRGESFFHCYGEAVKKSGRDIPLITRSWITRKQRVLPLARSSKDFTVEIKYNGEQWGAPYMVAGGRMANWHSYSFEDYLSDSGPEKAAQMWPGQPTANGKAWPSQPYKVVWQVRANGTHRIFPFYNPEWVRRSIQSMPVGTASGYTIEGLDAYFPKSPDYYIADPKDKSCNWLHQRDEMYWMTWGRLGYDPTTPDSVFDKRAAEILGPKSEPLVEGWKKISVALPKAFMAYSLGPDHRNHAPELEWGGDTNAYVQGQGFDSLSFLPINEEYANRATGGIDGRFSLWDISVGQQGYEQFFETAKTFLNSPKAQTREIANSVLMATALRDYYASRFRSAHELANIEATLGAPALNRNVEDIREASAAFDYMAKNSYYKPFTDRLRMHTNTFSWAEEAKKIAAERDRLLALPPTSKAVDFWAANMSGPAKGTVTWTEEKGDVVCRFQGKGVSQAWLLSKPLPSSTFFHKTPMRKEGDAFVATFKRERWGHAIAVEALREDQTNEASRFPNPQTGTPYLIVPSQAGPTPQFYNADEALAYLKPETLTAKDFGGILIGSRAQSFFNFSRENKRKLIAPVEQGLRLVILQQDFNKNKLDWLPKPLRIEGVGLNVFDPAGALNLPKVSAPGIIYQRFLPSEGWDVYGNGGIARLKLGKGEVWVTSARLMQSMHRPDAAKAFVRLLSLGGKQKPTVLVDSCSEGGEFTSSCHPDLMNSHDIPFVTLGETIVQEQGMDSFAVVPGPFLSTDVLNGQGQAIANAFLRGQVQQMAKRPTPKNLRLFETERVRRKKELMKSLGLDPMPPKTPLNARITGKIPRSGFVIEKVVYESRPHFYVTAHVYRPTVLPQSKLPIVVVVNGHWAHKKNEDRLQLPAAFLALQGYIALVIDSPGWSFEGNALFERKPEGDHNDFALVEGGTNTTGYYVWDAIRGLDYMATRTDTDMSKIGITGASGGGLETLYAFAADDRYTAAIPVVYMSSLELAPDNGCLCNHVPATMQVGDRSDIVAIQAPKPVYIMGAQNDGEFPPPAILLTHKKMAETWKLFGKDSDVFARIYPGPHDYNQAMRETMVGFFNKYMRRIGDGSPVAQPAIATIDPEDRELLVLDPPTPGERTMRELSLEYLANAPRSVPVTEVIRINGGLPATSDAKYREKGVGTKRVVIFESEPGLQTPGILILPTGKAKGLRIVVSDSGKPADLPNVSPDGYAYLYMDILGVGELAGVEMRYPVYTGRSVAFTGGWQIARAVKLLRKYAPGAEIEGHGPISSQAVMYAGLIDNGIKKVTGWDCLRRWEDVFESGIPIEAIQPRAHRCGTLASLRANVRNGEWHLRD